MLVRHGQHIPFKHMADRHLKHDEGEIQSFIVRVWHEAMDENGNSTCLRGVVEQVGSGQRAYFQDLSRIIAFIQKQLGIQPEPSTSKWLIWTTRLRDVFRKKPDERT
jgi:hypothetical protein